MSTAYSGLSLRKYFGQLWLKNIVLYQINWHKKCTKYHCNGKDCLTGPFSSPVKQLCGLAVWLPWALGAITHRTAVTEDLSDRHKQPSCDKTLKFKAIYIKTTIFSYLLVLVWCGVVCSGVAGEWACGGGKFPLAGSACGRKHNLHSAWSKSPLVSEGLVIKVIQVEEKRSLNDESSGAQWPVPLHPPHAAAPRITLAPGRQCQCGGDPALSHLWQTVPQEEKIQLAGTSEDPHWGAAVQVPAVWSRLQAKSPLGKAPRKVLPRDVWVRALSVLSQDMSRGRPCSLPLFSISQEALAHLELVTLPQSCLWPSAVSQSSTCINPWHAAAVWRLCDCDRSTLLHTCKQSHKRK